jgi:hypothetical protein
MEITLLIGASPYVLDESAALWLEETIRRRFSDDTGRPLDLDQLDRAGVKCLQLADVISEDLQNGDSPEPIELGETHISALAVILDDPPGETTAQLRSLVDACKRYNGLGTA